MTAVDLTRSVVTSAGGRRRETFHLLAPRRFETLIGVRIPVGSRRQFIALRAKIKAKSFFEVPEKNTYLRRKNAMSKKVAPKTEQLLQSLLSIHVPSSYLDYFDLYEVTEKKDCYELVLHEKESLVPKVPEGKVSVLDGFCNPLTVLTHSFSLKRIYLIIYRRRWKEAGNGRHYSNDYALHAKGIKMTPHFAAFLKAVDRITPCQYQHDSPLLGS